MAKFDPFLSLDCARVEGAIQILPSGNLVFRSLSGIQTLDLSNNHIRDVPLDSFHKMTRLEYLYLQVSFESTG